MSLSEPQVVRRARFAAAAFPLASPRLAPARDVEPVATPSYKMCDWLTCAPCPAVGAFGGRISFGQIARGTCAYFGISMTQLRNAGRFDNLIPARAVTAYLSAKHTHLSSVAIGRLMARDHTTVLHHIWTVRGILADHAVGKPLKTSARAKLRAISAISAGLLGEGEP